MADNNGQWCERVMIEITAEPLDGSLLRFDERRDEIDGPPVDGLKLCNLFRAQPLPVR